MIKSQRTLPFVSIIVPCFNEQETISLLLEGICAQTYPCELMEIVIADGMSTDGTRDEITAYAETQPDLTIKIVDNPKRIIPAGVNLAIAASKGKILVRMDAHSMPRPDYVSRSVTDIEKGLGDNVGGVWEIYPRGTSWIAKSIATAVSHPLGVGNAHYRFAEIPQIVDTVPFGAFRRNFLSRIKPPETGPGPYDETLLTNEDYEFNVRIRQAGGRVYLDPRIRTVYYARASLSALARQYWRYGYWKFRMLRRYPGTVRWRQALPPLFSLSILVMCTLAVFSDLAAWLLLLEVSIYLSILFVTSINLAAQKRAFYLIFGVPLAISIMHSVWGWAFLWSLTEYFVKKN